MISKRKNKRYQKIYRENRIAQGLCYSCGNPKVTKWLCQSCREKFNKRSVDYTQKLKRIVMHHYGDACACCKERNIKFLTVDHVHNDGKEHRKKEGRKDWGGRFIYQQIIKTNFPKSFQILCFNCNLGKSINNNVCPHSTL